MNYEQDYSHSHCWEAETPPCGLQGKHRCCLCKKPVPTMNWIDESVEKLRPKVITYSDRWEHMRNVLQPILDEWYKEFEPALRTALQEAHTKGTQEALAKVEEWANRTESAGYGMDTTYGDTNHPHPSVIYGRNEAKADLLHHLQQLKDNKTVTLEMNGSSGCGHIEYDTTCPHCHNIRTTTNTKTI